MISKIFKKRPKAIQTFTYFIPAPPKRKTGYREKEFDTAFYEFMKKNYKIISTHTASHADGMWFICVVESDSDKVCHFSEEEKIENRIDKELFYIDEEVNG